MDDTGESFFQNDFQLEILKPDDPIVRNIFRMEGYSFSVRSDYEGEIFINYAVKKTNQEEHDTTSDARKNVFILGDDNFTIFSLHFPWSRGKT